MRFLFVDRILHLSSEYIQGIKHITSDDYFLCQDPQGEVGFIPSLIGESLGQLAAWNIMFHNDFTKRPVAGVVASARLSRPAYVGETLLLESFIDDVDEVAVRYHSVARIGDEIVFQIENALGPLLPMSDFIDTDVVRSQFAEIFRPIAQTVARISANEERIHVPQLNLTSMVFDRILSIEPNVQLCAEKYISRSAAYFPDHFPFNPVLPMTVLLECKLNLAREFLARSSFNKNYAITELRRIKMNEFVRPGDVLICYLTVKQHNEHGLVLSFRSEVDGKRVCVLEVEMRLKE